MGSRRRKTPEERREELVRAAQEVFVQNGVESTTVSQIVKAANVAQGTFYLYFKTKNDIIDAIAEHIVDGMVDTMEAAVQQDHLTAIKKMNVFRQSIMEMAEDPDGVELGEVYHRPENQMVHHKMTDRIMLRLAPMLESVIRQGVEEGVYSIADSRVAAWFMLGGLNMLETGFTDRKELANALDIAFAMVTRTLTEKDDDSPPAQRGDDEQ